MLSHNLIRYFYRNTQGNKTNGSTSSLDFIANYSGSTQLLNDISKYNNIVFDDIYIFLKNLKSLTGNSSADKRHSDTDNRCNNDR